MSPASAAPKQPHHALSPSWALTWGHSSKNFLPNSLFPAHLSPRARLVLVSPPRAWRDRLCSPIPGPLHVPLPPLGHTAPHPDSWLFP